MWMVDTQRVPEWRVSNGQWRDSGAGEKGARELHGAWVRSSLGS